ncbi:MAG: hypothetical protein ACREX8_05760 [Gammaproteobacteria bacterium]
MHRLLWYFVKTQVDVVWWQVLNELEGRTVGLEDVRGWLEGRAPADANDKPDDEGHGEQASELVADARTEDGSTEDDQVETRNYGRHALREERVMSEDADTAFLRGCGEG